MGVNGGLPFKVCHSGLMGKSNAQPGPLRMHPRDEATLHHACVMLGNVTDFNVRNCAYMRLDLAPTVTRALHKKWFLMRFFVQNCSKCVSGRKSVPA